MATSKPNKSDLIPAAAYLRKSTKGIDRNGRERQEKSFDQQRREIEKLAKGRYKIIAWLDDEGISGWKRGDKRPGFQRLLRMAQEGNFKAVLCDDLDRFSRATVGEVWTDLEQLRAAGVHIVHVVNQGEYDLGNSGDIGTILKITVEIWSSNEYSRKLGRRIALSKRNLAKSKKRPGGHAPYAMKLDGNGGLEPGDPKHVEVVQWIFREFAENCRSMNSIAGELNSNGTPSPRGKKWHVEGVRQLLKQPAYRGDFRWGARQCGQFFIIKEDGEIAAASERERSQYVTAAKGSIYVPGQYEPIVEPKLWDAAAERLDSFTHHANGAGRRPKDNQYPLAGVLVCHHCGGQMYGCTARGLRLYRCSTNAKSGKGACGYYQIQEQKLLPIVMQLLAEEIDDVKRQGLRINAPDSILDPGKARDSEREEIEAEAATLRLRIDAAEDNLLMVADARTRQSLDTKVSAMRDELERIEKKLDLSGGGEEFTNDDLARMMEYLTSIEPVLLPFTRPDDGLEMAENCDSRKVRELLFELGAEVRLCWESQGRLNGDGKRARRRHSLKHCRIRLGQQEGEFSFSHDSSSNTSVERQNMLTHSLRKIDRVFSFAATS